jgi:nucleotide-binding universal stress UspA family protein
MTQTALHTAPKPGTDPTRTATYGALLVHAEPGLQSTQRVEFAGRLARELGACLIGVGAETFAPLMAADAPMPYAPHERIGRLMEMMEKDLQDAQQSFRRDAAGADLDWRRFHEAPSRALIRMAHAADLIVVSPRGEAAAGREADPGEVVINAGRPVLVVPSHSRRMRTDTVVVAWKDTRETRLAIVAALPLLRLAGDVVVQAISGEHTADSLTAQTDEVAAHLRRQGVKARARVSSSKDGVVNGLMRAVSADGADLIVAGAYGHSRMQELVFGGVTEHFLRNPACCVLMAH